MEFFSHQIRQPDEDLLKTMATLGSQIGQFIERKRAEAALHHAQMELAHVARVATLGEMTASIAHEINQPLGAIVNNANACLRWLAAQNFEEARQSAALVVADGHRAGEIITRIRALANKAPPRKEWLDINETIREVLALARSEVQRSGVALETRLSDDVHYVPLILADRIQLQQVILNLIVNGIEAMSEADNSARELLVSSGTAEARQVVVAVRDSGSGLDPKTLRPYLRPVLHDQGSGHGHGIGDQPLDYRNSRWQAMGDSESRQGLNVSVHVADGWRKDPMSETDGLVFIVDDDASMRESLKNLIRSVGLRVEAFTSAQEFLRSKRPDVPGCLVLDVRLQGLSGLDLQKRIADADMEIPIIFISGHGDIPMTVQAMKAGAVEFLTKPLTRSGSTRRDSACAGTRSQSARGAARKFKNCGVGLTR